MFFRSHLLKLSRSYLSLLRFFRNLRFQLLYFTLQQLFIFHRHALATFHVLQLPLQLLYLASKLLHLTFRPFQCSFHTPHRLLPLFSHLPNSCQLRRSFLQLRPHALQRRMDHLTKRHELSLKLRKIRQNTLLVPSNPLPRVLTVRGCALRSRRCGLPQRVVASRRRRHQPRLYSVKLKLQPPDLLFKLVKQHG